MAQNSTIEWTHHTFNPWEGCTKIGPGCDHCYAETRNNRFRGGNWGPGAPRRKTSESNWRQPIKWNKQAATNGTRYRVFCASLADVFDNEVDPQWRAELFLLIKQTPNLDWLLLTKRIGNARAMLPDDWGRGYPNVWLGISVVNQVEADRDIQKLSDTPAHLRFLSIEPLLGSIDLRFPTKTWAEDRCDHCCNGDRCGDSTHHDRGNCPFCRGSGRQKVVDWVILGGESGPGSRPMHPDWARALRDQCEATGVPFLFKQWGEWAPEREIAVDGSPLSMTWQNNSVLHICEGGERVYRAGKKLAGRTLDGKLHDEYPIVDEE